MKRIKREKNGKRVFEILFHTSTGTRALGIILFNWKEETKKKVNIFRKSTYYTKQNPYPFKIYYVSLVEPQ